MGVQTAHQVKTVVRCEHSAVKVHGQRPYIIEMMHSYIYLCNAWGRGDIKIEEVATATVRGCLQTVAILLNDM